MTVAVDAAILHSFVSDGSSSYTAIPLRITSVNDILVFDNGVQLASGTYSVSAIVSTDPYTFTLSLSPAIASGNKVLVIQQFPIQQDTNLVPGDPLRSASYNLALDKITIMLKDQLEIQNLTNLRYNIGDADQVTDAMKAIPIPTSGDDSTALTWNTATGFAWELNHPGGQTVDQFKAQLATSGGAALVGYDTGAGASTVQAQIAANVSSISTNAAAVALNTAFRTLLGTAATSETASGAYNVTFWNGTSSESVQYRLSVFVTPATDEDHSGAASISVWDQARNSADNVQALFNRNPVLLSHATKAEALSASTGDTLNLHFTTSTT